MAIVSINVVNGQVTRLTGGYDLNSKKLETNYKPDHKKKISSTNSSIEEFPEKHQNGNFKLLDVYKNHVVAVISTPSQPQYMVWAEFKSKGSVLDWRPVDENDYVGTTYKDIKWSVGAIKYADHQDPYEYTIIEPRNAKAPLPLVVFSHGGPHSILPIHFSPDIAGIVRCGYAVLVVNYRGSIGFGEIQIKSLCGKIGIQDINDVQNCVKKLVSSGIYDKNKVVCMGGSHGGFISSHLIGQFPNYYRAACIRNPVIDLCSMFGTTDIPDWVMTEADLKYDYGTVLIAEDYRRLYKKSPIRYVNSMRTPVLLLLGQNDKRVPNSQGLLLRNALLARDVECRTLIYPNDSHPLNSVEAQTDCFMNIILFMNKHTSGDACKLPLDVRATAPGSPTSSRSPSRSPSRERESRSKSPQNSTT